MPLFLRASALAVLLALAPSALSQDLAPRVFPNPISAERAVTVEVADASAATLEVVDVLGRRLAPEAGLAAGTYLVRAVYADGRASEPTPVTVATPGPVEFRLASPAAQEAAAPLSAPAPEAVQAQGEGCSTGDVVFGGFNHVAYTGSLRLRSDLVPKSLRAQPAAGTNVVDFVTCFGDVQGVSYRYIAGGAAGNRPFRVLSPSIVGNTEANFTASYFADGTDRVALYGTFEVALDDDGDVSTAEVPAIQIGFDPAFSAPRSREAQVKGIGGGYQLLIFNDEELVYEGFPADGTPLYATPSGEATRINLLRSILVSSVADGFEVEAASSAPGDLKAAFTFESGDGSPVRFHVGAGAPVATGTTVHIVPSVPLTDPASVAIREVRTYAPGVNRFGIRALQFAAGGKDMHSGKGPGVPVSDAQWGRPQGDDLEPHVFDVFDGSFPLVFVGSAGEVEDYGIQWGREPQGLVETPSDGLGLYHGGGLIVKQGAPTGVNLDEDGDFYRSTALVRNFTDVQGERIIATLTNVGGRQTAVTVESANGAFSTYEFFFDRDLDGRPEVRQTGVVGEEQVFGRGNVTVLSSAAFGGSEVDFGTNQTFSVGFLVELGNGEVGAAYVYPNWTSENAEVNVRSYATEAHEPHINSDLFEMNEGGMSMLDLHRMRTTAE